MATEVAECRGARWRRRLKTLVRFTHSHDGERVLRSVAARIRTDVPLVMLDLLLVFVAYVLAFLLRFDFSVPAGDWHDLKLFVPLVLCAHVVTNLEWGLYRQMWRHASIKEAMRVLGAVTTAGLVGVLARELRLVSVPLSVTILGPMIAVLLLGGLRFQARLFSLRQARANAGTDVVVVGAGAAGAAILREMQREGSVLRPVAVVDDNVHTHGRRLMGVKIEGSIDELAEVCERHDASQVLLAIPSASNETVQRVVAEAEHSGVALKILPPIADRVGGTASLRDVRDLRIEDLLGRAQVATDMDSVRRLLTGRRVLITGAGGSIGSEIARQVAACQPELLLMLDHDETHLHDARAGVRGEAVQLLVDIRDRERLLAVVRKWAPQVVFHAAAHKHVPILEANPTEAVRTNVLGTQNVVDAARDIGVDTFVFISTDKAVRPSSVMGASKRIGEHIVLSSDVDGARFCAVRFGNVLGSRGSVVPTFARQIASGQPVTVTDPRMTRFFMSTPEAVQLVLQSAALAQGGDVLMLEMGEPCRIVELAERMIRLSGREVGRDVEITFTGMRPGEKLHEELRAPDETATPTTHPSIVRLRPATLSQCDLRYVIDRLGALADAHMDEESAAELLFAAHACGETIDLDELGRQHLPDPEIDLVALETDRDFDSVADTRRRPSGN